MPASRGAPHLRVASPETANTPAGKAVMGSLGRAPSGALFSHSNIAQVGHVVSYENIHLQNEWQKLQFVSYTQGFGLPRRIFENSLTRDLHEFPASKAADFVSSIKQPNRAPKWQHFSKCRIAVHARIASRQGIYERKISTRTLRSSI